MVCAVGDGRMHYVEHGQGAPVLVLHGAGVDHREVLAAFDPALAGRGGLRRIYPDLPGMGRTPAPPDLRSGDDVLQVLLDFIDEVVGADPLFVVGHSAGAYYAQGIAALRPDRVLGLALVCPMSTNIRNVPDHRPVVATAGLGDDEFRGYFVVQTPAMLERYEQAVEPGMELVDHDAMARMSDRWQLTSIEDAPYPGHTLVVAGRRDSVVGYAAAVELFDQYPNATLAVLDGTGHALPHEKPEALLGLLDEWLVRAGQAGSIST